MPYELCRKTKVNGMRCQAAALTGENFCFFHTRLLFRHRAVRQSKPSAGPTPLLLPAIEDRESIQVAASIIVGALATGHLDDKRAASLLRGLQVASRNLADFVNLEPRASTTVRSFSAMLDGVEIAPRAMSDNSTPPQRPATSPIPSPVSLSADLPHLSGFTENQSPTPAPPEPK